ncbi:hypothetical protein Trco_004570 [Trichoderma cornu-damae]|uniref:Uncharacterized protein n=1 Tax=Trichoderma cornu-damae TaxID=654480 RepID=A0A9P8TXN2_9HYPO|nr:hypothetical protein Trco_004570 [Trichoderma cornu-damae]
MEEFDGLVSYFPTAKRPLNESFLRAENLLDRLPTTENVLLHTLVLPNNNRGIQPYVFALNLYGNGCKTSGGDVNCTQACGHREFLFQDWQTQWNCLTLTNMALNKPNTQEFVKLNASGDTKKALDHLGVADLTEFDAIGVLEKFFDCFNASCPDKRFKECYIPWPDLSSSKDTVNTTYLGRNLATICATRWMDVNPDLAGPGVISSYIISTVIVLYAWLCIRFLRVASSMDWFVRWTRYRGKINSLITFHQSRLALRLEHATSTFVAEMQEAQCFFVFAIQVGLIHANFQPPEFFGVDSWQKLLYNRSIMKEFAVTAALPILLNQILLCKVQLDSVYSLLLCTMVFVMAYAASLASIVEDFDEAYDMFSSPDSLGKCGRIASLRSFCAIYAETGIRHPPFLLEICSVALSLFWYKKLWTGFAGTQWLKSYAKSLSEKQNFLLFSAIQLGQILVVVFIFAAEIIFATFMIANLFPLNEMLTGLTETYIFFSSSWTIGQLISVLVWAPVVAKYLYLLMFGVENGFRIRVSRAFAVTEKSDQSSGQENPADQDRDST